MGEHRAGRATDRKAARREELLDAAVDAIRRHGPGVSMHELAAAAGVTKPILYRHFGDRDGLVAALAARFSAELLASLRAALVRGTGDARGSVTATVDAFVAFLEREPEVYRLLVQQARAGGLSPPGAELRQPGAAEVIGGFLRQVGDDVAIVLGEQLRAAGRDSGGAEVLAHGIVGFVHAAGDWWIERRTMPRQRLVTYVTDLLWGGLASLGLGPEGETG